MKVMVTGHRPQHLSPEERGSARVNLHTTLKALQARHPTVNLISGMAIGADIWAAEAALDLGIPIIAAVPFRGQESRWHPAVQEHYRDILSKCAEVHIVSDEPYHPGLFHVRNAWMVERANLALAIWNGKQSGGTWDTVKRIHKANLPCLVLWLGDANKLSLDLPKAIPTSRKPQNDPGTVAQRLELFK